MGFWVFPIVKKAWTRQNELLIDTRRKKKAQSLSFLKDLWPNFNKFNVLKLLFSCFLIKFCLFVFRATMRWTDGKDLVLMIEMLGKDIYSSKASSRERKHIARNCKYFKPVRWLYCSRKFIERSLPGYETKVPITSSKKKSVTGCHWLIKNSCTASD